MDMRILYYSVAIVGGIILTIAGAYLAGAHYKEKQNTEVASEDSVVASQSTWITHYNKYESDLAPLEQQWDSLGKEWWMYYNEQNFDMAKETNAKMKLLSEQMHILLEKYKATKHE